MLITSYIIIILLIIVMTICDGILINDYNNVTPHCPKHYHCVKYDCSHTNGPYNNLNVSYLILGPRGLHEHLINVKCGQPLDRHLAIHHPIVQVKNAFPTALYSVAMIDPDVPNAQDPKYAQWRHWLIVNVPGGQLLRGEPLEGEHITKYHGPGPPKGSGWHRYLVLVYHQEHYVNINTTLPLLKRRARFNIQHFAHAYKLHLIASTMFHSHH